MDRYQWVKLTLLSIWLGVVGAIVSMPSAKPVPYTNDVQVLGWSREPTQAPERRPIVIRTDGETHGVTWIDLDGKTVAAVDEKGTHLEPGYSFERIGREFCRKAWESQWWTREKGKNGGAK